MAAATQQTVFDALPQGLIELLFLLGAAVGVIQHELVARTLGRGLDGPVCAGLAAFCAAAGQAGGYPKAKGMVCT